MKRLVICFIAVLFLAGCGQTIRQSEFLQHDKMYKNWDHMKFSWFGHNNPTEDVVQKSIEQEWWGFEIPYVPGE